MANEAQITAGLNILKDNLNFRSLPTTFNADVSSAKGPTPGAVEVSVDGTDIDLTELTVYGFCVIQNQDSTNYIEVGIQDPETEKFYPLIRLLAGESYVIRLSPDLGEEYGTGAGTGTTGADTNTLRIKADTAACNVFVGAFEV